jgi:hypothetical protein
MSKVEILIQEIRTLPAEDLQKVIQELLHQADRLQLAKEVIEKIAGMGNGIWTTDSQAYIQELRTNERWKHDRNSPRKRGEIEIGWK